MSLFDSQLIRFISFGSGSCGNCYYLGTPTDAILIDSGVGIRKLKRRFHDYGIKLSDIRAIFITHDHCDHVKSVAVLSSELHIPVFALPEVHRGMACNRFLKRKVQGQNVRTVEFGTALQLADFVIQAFPVPHDATANAGYSIRIGSIVFTVMTDVGIVTEDINSFIRQATHLVIEANYDPQMLSTGPYPKELQKRISNGYGHLSNYQTAAALIANYHADLKRVWLCHLSAENNHPELARHTIETHLQEAGITVGTDLQLDVLRREDPTGPFEL